MGIFIPFAQPIELPPYWLNHPQVVQQYSPGNLLPEQASVLNVPHACPLSIKWSDEAEWWQLPIEPVVTISCKNIITKRTVLKADESDVQRRGSVKELWTQDDYEVSISGLFINDKEELPEDDLRKLRKYCEGRKVIEVMSPLFTLFNITKLAIEDYQFPFTKGISAQMFSIKAVSDDWGEDNLLIAAK